MGGRWSRSRAAASPPPSTERAAIAGVGAGEELVGGRWPMSPVEQTPLAGADLERGTDVLGGAVGVEEPSGPVHAFAPPELRITARTAPALRTCCDHRTGAGLTRLRVKTPAAAASGPSLTTSATSMAPLDFSPATTPAARKP